MIEREEILKLAKIVYDSQTWPDVEEEVSTLCYAAGLLDEWEAADGGTFEEVAYRAAEILKVDI